MQLVGNPIYKIQHQNNFFLKDFNYLLMRDTQRERHRHRQRAKQAQCREPNVGFDSGTPGLHPGPKADTQLQSHPDVPQY